jgi:RHS repeat-associated protein
MTIQLTGVNRTGSPLLSLSQGAAQDFTWSPYGNCPARSAQAALLPGFNGERQDPLTGVTHLGNGYRAYNPTLMRFTCPDSHSPFGNGGVNPYAYCSGDPINQTDPSGHGPALWTVLAGTLAGEISAADAATYALVTAAMVAQRNARKIAIGAGIASLAVSLQVASNKTEESNPQASRNLQWAALGLGVAVSAYLVGKDTYRVVRKIMRMVSQPSRLVMMSGEGTAPAAPENRREPRPLEGAVRHGLIFENDGGAPNAYIPGGMANGEDVIVVHGTENSDLVAINGNTMNAFGLEYFLGQYNIDLRANRTPLHLISCGAAGASGNSFGVANLLAAVINRPVITYGRGGDIGLLADYMENAIAGNGITVYERRFPCLPFDIVLFSRIAQPHTHSPNAFYSLQGIQCPPGGLFNRS